MKSSSVRILAAALFASLAFAVAACSSDEPGHTKTTTKTTESTPTQKSTTTTTHEKTTTVTPH